MNKNFLIYYACERIRIFLSLYAGKEKTFNQSIIDKTCKESKIDSLIQARNWRDLFSNADWLRLLEETQNLSSENEFLKEHLETIMRFFPEETAGYLEAEIYAFAN